MHATVTKTVLLSCIARDSAGEAVIACLDRENIDNSYVETIKGDTGCSIIMLDAKSGERTVLTHRGVSGKMNSLDVHDLETIAPDWLYATSLRGDMDTFVEVFRKSSSAWCEGYV